MESIEGGRCAAGMWAAGAITGTVNFWNPVGWAAWSLVAIDAACIGYSIANA